MEPSLDIGTTMAGDAATKLATEAVLAQMDDEQKAEVKKTLVKKYSSWRWRLDNLYKIINKDGTEIQFRMNLAQKILFLGLWFCNLVLKSRQHGITTFACIFFLDYCVFNSNISAAIIAHNKEDAEDFFVRYVKHGYDNLPAEVRSAVKATRDSTRRLSFSNGSSLRVTTSGRSGTYQLVHVSELGKIAAKYPEKAREIKTGTLNAIHPGNIVIIESTAEGREGDFYDMCDAAQKAQKAAIPLTSMDYKFFFFPWFRNALNVLPTDEAAMVPILDYQAKYFAELKAKHGIHLTMERKAWYIKKWNVQGDDMRREHPSTPEEAFEAAIIGCFYGEQFVAAREQKRITRVPHQPGTLVDTWWDLGMRDAMSIWFTQDIGREIHVLRYYQASDAGFEHYVNKLDEFSKDPKDGGYGYRYGRHTAPHDIRQRELFSGNGKSRLMAAKKLGITFEVAPDLSIEAGIEQVRQILAICWFDEAGCTTKYAKMSVGLPSLEQYRKEWNEKLGTYLNHPLHNWASHGADAFRTLGTAHQFRNAAAAWAAQNSQSILSTGQTPSRNIDKKDPGGWT